MGLLGELADKHPSIGEVRGRGLFVGIELVKNRESRQMLVPFNAKGEAAKAMTEIVKFSMQQGLYLSTFSNVIRVTPPLNISHEDLTHGVDILDRALDIADKYTV